LRVNALVRLIDAIDLEIRAVAGPLRVGRASRFRAVQAVPGVGPVLAAIFVAEIGDVHRFAGPAQLASWAGLTPKHRESDTVVRRGPITKQGSTMVRWAAVEAAPGRPQRGLAGADPHPHRRTQGSQHRHRRGRPQAAHPRLLRPARRTHPCPRRRQGGVSGLGRDRTRVILCLTPVGRRRGRLLD
jgi:transposase